MPFAKSAKATPASLCALAAALESIMGIAARSAVTFRIFGDDLVPSNVTALLGCEPSLAYNKGDVRIGPNTGNRYIEKTGRWTLSAEEKRPEDIPAQITEILTKLTQDLNVWNQLKSQYEMSFFCGVFMGSFNDGLLFPSQLLGQLSERGITLDLDIYNSDD